MKLTGDKLLESKWQPDLGGRVDISERLIERGVGDNKGGLVLRSDVVGGINLPRQSHWLVRLLMN